MTNMQISPSMTFIGQPMFAALESLVTEVNLNMLDGHLLSHYAGGRVLQEQKS
jgi:hypothetical protein